MKKLQEELVRKGLDFALFATYEHINCNLFYLTGYVGAGILIVLSNGKPILHVPSRDLTQAKQVEGVEISSGKKFSEMIADKGLKSKKAGIDFANISVSSFNDLKEKIDCEFTDLSDFMNEVRMIKGSEEVDKIRKACGITDEILDKFVKNFKNFNTEEDAAAFLVYETHKRGCGLAFEPIVASGVNAAVPHHSPKGKMHNGFCVVDFGVKYQGYCSDITRTFYFGTPSKNEEKIYNDLLKEQERAISLVKAGVMIGEICVKSESGLKQKLIHSLGHGMGIEVHEAPFVNKESKLKLKEGMVITIEPGEYVEGKYGIRIEDDVLVTKNGFDILTKFTKKLIRV